MNIVKVGKMPGTLSEVVLEDGATVSQALESAGLESAGYSLRLNQAFTTLSSIIKNGDLLILVPEIKSARV